MPLFVKRYDNKEIIQVRKYICSEEESIWSNQWYGRHVIGKDCDWITIDSPIHQSPLHNPLE